MSRGKNPLVWMMALSLPGAAHALGLGEIHVNSALNEPLAADIEILGATAEELSSLTASVANKDTFLRFGAERPAFLASTTFRVSHDVSGKPVLAIRSTDSFTDPLVNLLVDLRWHNGEVIRQYSLLLDPAGFPAATQVAAAVPSPVIPLPALVPPAPAAAATNTLATAATPIASLRAAASPAASATRTTTHVRIGAKATLRGVAWRVGARSDADIKKTMLAIFRANPHAFDGNINRLRRGAVLTIPPTADISTISKEDAGREIRAQMTAWRASPQKARTALAPALKPVPVQTMTPAVPAAAPIAATARTVAADAPGAAINAGSDAAQTAALNLRVQSLEQGLQDMQAQLEREQEKLRGVQAQVRDAANAVNGPVAAVPAPRQWLLPSVLIGGIALLAGALGAMLLKLRRRATPKVNANGAQAVSAPMDKISSPVTKHVVAEEPVSREALRTVPRAIWQDSIELRAARSAERDEAYEDTLDLSGETAILEAGITAASGDTANLPAATVNLNARALQTAAVAAAGETATAEESVAAEKSATADDSATVMVNAEELNVDTTRLDYNLMDLDLTAQHVQMPSVLHERVVVKERRTNLVDVLKKAVEREPDRRDLRMKLLETYYAAAATNRLAFLEVVQRLALDRDRLDEGEWDKIAVMGRQIAADSALFSEDSEAEDDNELADCA